MQKKENTHLNKNIGMRLLLELSLYKLIIEKMINKSSKSKSPILFSLNTYISAMTHNIAKITTI